MDILQKKFRTMQMLFYKKTPARAGVFPDAMKGRKGEKEIGILNYV